MTTPLPDVASLPHDLLTEKLIAIGLDKDEILLVRAAIETTCNECWDAEEGCRCWDDE